MQILLQLKIADQAANGKGAKHVDFIVYCLFWAVTFENPNPFNFFAGSFLKNFAHKIITLSGDDMEALFFFILEKLCDNLLLNLLLLRGCFCVESQGPVFMLYF